MAVTAAAGVLVGVLRRVFRLPAKLPGTVEEIKDGRVEPSTVLKAVAVSLVSLAGGASLGPEDALGKLGGGLGTWVSERRKLSEEMRATNTHTGMSAAYGGLLSAPILATILVLELARPKATRFMDTLVGGLLSVVGRVRGVLSDRGVDVRRDLRASVVQVRGLAAARRRSPGPGRRGARADHHGRDRGPHATRRSSRRSDDPSLDVGGVAFGLVGVALPLTLFTGTSQLTTVIHDGAALGAGVLIAIVFAKILVFAVCEATGFIGGPFLVMLFIGGTAGIAAHVLIPGLPEGARVHGDVRRPSGIAGRRPVLADPARRHHDADRRPADSTRHDRRHHRLPRRLRLGSAHRAGATATQARRLRRLSKDTLGSEWFHAEVAADRGVEDEYNGTVDVGYEADEAVGQPRTRIHGGITKKHTGDPPDTLDVIAPSYPKIDDAIADYEAVKQPCYEVGT